MQIIIYWETRPLIVCQSVQKNSTYTEDHYCKYCDSSCFECLLPGNASACYSCSSSTPYFTPLYEGAAIGTCTTSCIGTYTNTVNLKCQSCPINTYKDDQTQTCLECHESCFGCTEPENANKCLGCSSKYPFLRLSSKTAMSGVCSKMCGTEEVILRKFVCVPNNTTTVFFEAQAQTLSLSVSRITLIIIVIGAVVSMIFVGSFELLIISIGNLQTMLFYALISVPNLPAVLSTFYSYMDFAFFQYFPNIMLYYFKEKSTFSHPALPTNLFIINIGNLFFFQILILFIYLISSYLSEISSLAHVLCVDTCLLYTSPSPRDLSTSRMPSSA
eukprot:TRINITY_DN34729_c0_g1_i1.p1 TRINITY_DN34729_c0_g1~~TRINITY_DN34729_c0_g1_i1.p1  ORF type:complete len:330 (-),score=4.51 TRINITY_DN34729_c0_g1_i1:120-1109(-)